MGSVIVGSMERADERGFLEIQVKADELSMQGRFEEAIELAATFRNRDPGSLEGRFLFARLLLYAGRVSEAEQILAEISHSDPRSVELEVYQAVCHQLRGQFESAETLLARLYARRDLPESWRAVVAYNLSWHSFRSGETRTGLALISEGRKARLWGNVEGPPESLLRPGDAVRGKTVMVCGEGGAGDELINLRFARVIEERGGEVIWLSDNGLESLASRSPGVTHALARTQLHGIPYDVWAPAMDLGWILGVGHEEIEVGAYVFPEPSRVEHWKNFFPATGKPRVGLRWRGNPTRQVDRLRSVTFSLLAPLAQISGLDFYSLQRDTGSEELPPASVVRDLAPLLTDWEATAGAISHLDLVITTCTSIAHLAGAMGKPTWLLCPLDPYYLWAADPTVVRWYPQLRLFRQTRFGDWFEALEKITIELQNYSRSHEECP